MKTMVKISDPDSVITIAVINVLFFLKKSKYNSVKF